MFTCKPDYEQAQKRMDAFWQHAETDRPAVLMTFPKPQVKPVAKKNHATYKDYWLDIEYRAEEMSRWAESAVFFAEAMPVCMPNLGPGILSAWAGCNCDYGPETVWTSPCVSDWEGDRAVIDTNHPLFSIMDRFTRLLTEKAKGRFIVGLTDFHPGGDHLSAIRGVENLAVDLLEYPDIIKAKLASSYKEYFPVFDYFTDLIKSAGMPLSTWLPLTSEEGMYVPSNDFSYMISTEMFNEFFLQGIIEECRHYKRSIYHVDGVGSLRHLDALLEIPELNAIQWVPGAGKEWVYPWFDLFKKILAAGKSIIVYPQNIGELRFIAENLPARGVCIQMWNVSNESEALDIMNIIERKK